MRGGEGDRELTVLCSTVNFELGMPSTSSFASRFPTDCCRLDFHAHHQASVHPRKLQLSDLRLQEDKRCKLNRVLSTASHPPRLPGMQNSKSSLCAPELLNFMNRAPCDTRSRRAPATCVVHKLHRVVLGTSGLFPDAFLHSLLGLQGARRWLASIVVGQPSGGRQRELEQLMQRRTESLK